jgi:hypothetical protein
MQKASTGHASHILLVVFVQGTASKKPGSHTSVHLKIEAFPLQWLFSGQGMQTLLVVFVHGTASYMSAEHSVVQFSLCVPPRQ